MNSQNENQKQCPLTLNYFDSICNEVYLNIFKYLDILGINNVFMVCKEWSYFSDSEYMWKLLFQSKFPSRFKYGRPNKTKWKELCMAHTINLMDMKREFNQEEVILGYMIKGAELYAGEWKIDPLNKSNLIKNGKGSEYKLKANKDTDDIRDAYVGEFVDGKFDGFGIQFWSNGNKYLGDWSCGKQSGKGQFFWTCGESYSGLWENSLREGKGRYTFKDGGYYEGIFRKNKIDGEGVYRWRNGSYEGTWLNNQRHGFGSIEWFDTMNKYRGFFDNNKKNLYGIYRWKDNSFYEGEWQLDKRCGVGKTIWSNGIVYLGNYKNDYRNGQGYLLWNMEEGIFFSGNFKDGGRRGNGKLYKCPVHLLQDKMKLYVKEGEITKDNLENKNYPTEKLYLMMKEFEEKYSNSFECIPQRWEEPCYVQYSLEIPPLYPTHSNESFPVKN